MTWDNRKPPHGVMGKISTDKGRTWLGEVLLYADHAPNGDCSYPASTRLDDGTIITAYYSVGPDSNINDGKSAHCNVVIYSEESLIKAAKKSL